MNKYQTIKQMFINKGYRLIRIHTPALPKKASYNLTSFFFKDNDRTYKVDYEIKGNFITSEDIEKILEEVK